MLARERRSGLSGLFCNDEALNVFRQFEQSFNSRYDLLMHGRQEHLQGGSNTCETCNANFESRIKLKVIL
jgi:hypothetical protein